MANNKDFDGWNGEKKQIHFGDGSGTFVKEGFIYYTKLGVNVGFEQDGKEGFERPVLVISRIGSMFFSIPMTTQGKDDSRFYYKLESVDFGFDSYLILSQGRVLDRKRFLEESFRVSKNELFKIKKLLKDLYLPEVDLFPFSDESEKNSL